MAMSDNSAIEWTTHTFNPWWGCVRISPGCRNCYADDLAHRWGKELWRRKGDRQIMADPYWRKPLKWNRDAEAAGEPAMVFCASMADVFEAHPVAETRAVQDIARARLWDLIERTPWLRWQLLTKRPENVAEMVPWSDDWPNGAWLGASVEDQRRADERVRSLLAVPAKTHFLSCEPLLGPVDLTSWLDPSLLCLSGCANLPTGSREQCSVSCRQLGGTMGMISWCIVGGESGPRARPMHPDWARSLRDQCRHAYVPFLFKQWGGRTPKAGGRELDGRTWDEYPAVTS